MDDDDTNTSIDREAATDLVKQWLSMWNGDTSIAAQIIAPNNRVHAGRFDGGDRSDVGGVSGMVTMVTQMRSLMSDLVCSTDVGPIVDGNHVVLRWIARGHYGGGIPNAGAPAGAPVTFHGTGIVRISDRLIVERWLNADTSDLVTQLEVGAT